MRNILYILIFLMAASFIACGERTDEVEVLKDTVSGETAADQEMGTGDTAGSESSSITEEANDLGMTPGLPADYPSDVPKPQKGKVLGTIKSSDGNVVTFETSETIAEIVTYYKNEMSKSGYSIPEGEEKISDKGGLITWNREQESVELMLSRNEEKGITSIVVTYK